MSPNRTLVATLVLASSVTLGVRQASANPQLSNRELATPRLSGLARDLACAPFSPMVKPAPALVVVGGREHRKTLFGTGDALVIRGGAAQGIKAGDEFFIRRVVDDRYNEHEPGVYPVSISTAGTAQIVETQNDYSVAVITSGCDGVIDGDYLERYEPPATAVAPTGTTPDYAQPARLMLGAERRQMGGPGEFMILDRGSSDGIRPGQQLTIFRRTVAGGPVADVGKATVYTLQPGSSVVRIDSSVDAVYVGDLVAIHR
jgi:hypothetical protein